jgi:protein gp37
MRTRASVRWVSYEPMLAAVDWRPWFKQGLNWLIVGGESGPDFAPMDLSWLVDTIKQCRDAGVPLFVKQDSGQRPGMKGRIPDELWVRDYPKR